MTNSPATLQQYQLIRELLPKHEYAMHIPIDEQLRIMDDTQQKRAMSRLAASTMLRNILETPIRLDEGYYRVLDKTYKVLTSEQGRKYAKVLTEEGKWIYAPSKLNTIRNLGKLLTVEEAAAQGRLYGFCIVCSRRLTDEESIAAGIGPVCAKRLGGT